MAIILSEMSLEVTETAKIYRISHPSACKSSPWAVLLLQAFLHRSVLLLCRRVTATEW